MAHPRMESFAATVFLRGELLVDTFERIAVSPLGPICGIVSLVLFPVLQCPLTAMVTLLVAGTVFGLPLHSFTVPLAAPILLLSAISGASFALLLAAAVMLVQPASDNLASGVDSGSQTAALHARAGAAAP